MRESKASNGNAEFGRVNAVIEEIDTHLVNLAQGHATDRQIIQGVQDVNTTILKEVNRIKNALNAVVSDIAILQLQNNPKGGEKMRVKVSAEKSVATKVVDVGVEEIHQELCTKTIMIIIDGPMATICI